MSSTYSDIIVIGCGIVGASVGMQLQKKYPNRKVLIIEKESYAAKHQTGNNSGVIHSGIYYKPGSYKATNCIEGYRQLLSFCDTHGIPYEICGKLIVQTKDSEITSFENILKRGYENKLSGLKVITREEAKEIEPHLQCQRAIIVPQTGIIDYKVVTNTYVKVFESMGGQVYFDSKVLGYQKSNKSHIIETTKGTFEGKFVINCAGLYSDKITKMNSDLNDTMIIPFRGEYYKLNEHRRHLVKHLIYPVPNPDFPFLGVHFTRMIDGEVEAGPNAVLAFRKEGYSKWDIDLKELYQVLSFPGFRKIASKYWDEGWMEMKRSFSKKLFVKAMQELIPEIKVEDVQPGGAGVRAQACHRDGQLLDDFCIVQNNTFLNVVNAPSPAATSSLSIGKYIAEKISF